MEKSRETIMKTLLIDIDGVLCNFNKSLLQKINADYRIELTMSHIKHYDLSCLPVSREYLNNLYHDTYFYRTMEPVQDASWAIKILQNYFKVKIITSRPARLSNVTYNWFEQHIPSIDIEYIIFTPSKDTIQGSWLIDDNPEVLMSHGSWSPIKMNYLYNKYVPILGFDTWRQIVGALVKTV